MSDQKSKQEEQPGFVGWIKRFAAPVGSFIGAGLLIYQVIQLWRGDQDTVAWLFAGLGALLLLAGLVYVGFSQVTLHQQIQPGRSGKINLVWKEPRFPRGRIPARWGILIYLTVIAGLGFLLWQHGAALEEKTILLLTRLDGPDSANYRVTEIIYTALVEQLVDESQIEIILLPDQVITEVQGSAVARSLGERYHADLVLWGWYGATDSNVLLTLHFENLSELEPIDLLNQSDKMVTQAAIGELDSFTMQQDLGEGLGGLVLFINGLSRYDAGETEAALEKVNQALAAPTWLDAVAELDVVYFVRANIYHTLQQWDVALQDYNQAIQLNPELAMAYCNRSAVYNTLSQFNLAYDDLTRAMQLDPQVALFFNNRGGVLNNLGRYEEAILDFDQAVQLDPAYSLAYNNRGTSYWALNNFEQALADFTQAIRYDSRNVTAYTNRCSINSDLGQYSKAIADCNRAIRLDPGEARAYNDRGIAYDKRGNTERALHDFNTSIQLNPQSATTFMNRGIIYYELGEFEKAEADYNQALGLDPENPRIYYNRGSNYYASGQYEQSLADFDRGVQLAPDNPGFYFLRGLSYFQLQNYEQTVVDCNASIELDPQNAEVYLLRGAAYSFLDQPEQTRSDYQQALAFCGSDEALCQQIREALAGIPDP